jgi:FkbM family methyltransferase
MPVIPAEMTLHNISYSQRFEDFHLLRCFPDQRSGSYIDIGAGHPVYDNVTFAFYLRGWRGITVEPNPWLSQLSLAVRPRDEHVQALVGARIGETDFYLVEDFHGMSTTSAANAQAVAAEFGKKAQAMKRPVTTLATLCDRHTRGPIDILKIDVEGAELDVLKGGDWRRFRPKVVVLEAFAPVTLAPAWQPCEALLNANNYTYAFFDSLNRYYVANEHAEIAARLAAEPPSFEGVKKFRDFKPALDDASHPDHRLAMALAGTDMIRLPLLEPDAVTARLMATLPAAENDRSVTDADVRLTWERLFGGELPPDWSAELALSRDATLHQLYSRIVTSERFQTACGRISASYAW